MSCKILLDILSNINIRLKDEKDINEAFHLCYTKAVHQAAPEKNLQQVFRRCFLTAYQKQTTAKKRRQIT